jgi:hypothetical protein
LSLSQKFRVSTRKNAEFESRLKTLSKVSIHTNISQALPSPTKLQSFEDASEFSEAYSVLKTSQHHQKFADTLKKFSQRSSQKDSISSPTEVTISSKLLEIEPTKCDEVFEDRKPQLKDENLTYLVEIQQEKAENSFGESKNLIVIVKTAKKLNDELKILALKKYLIEIEKSKACSVDKVDNNQSLFEKCFILKITKQE